MAEFPSRCGRADCLLRIRHAAAGFGIIFPDRAIWAAIGENGRSWVSQDQDGKITTVGMETWYPKFKDSLKSVISTGAEIWNIELGCNGTFFITDEPGRIKYHLDDHVKDGAFKDVALGRTCFCRALGRRGSYIIESADRGIWDLKGAYKGLDARLSELCQERQGKVSPSSIQALCKIETNVFFLLRSTSRR